MTKKAQSSETDLSEELDYMNVHRPQPSQVDISRMTAEEAYEALLSADNEVFHCQITIGEAIAVHATSAEDFEKFMKKKEDDDPADLLPAAHKHLAHAFNAAEARKLADRRPGVDHPIQLMEGAKLPYKKPYAMSQRENDAIKKWIDDQLAQGFIRRSSSQTCAPVIVIKKPSGGLRVCVDYRALNAITVKNRYPIPNIRETLGRVAGKRYYIKLDVIAAFNQIRVAEGHEWMTAFNTRFGQYESLVMPFGLCNAPATFQAYVNKELHQFLDEFVSVYLDDVLIFSDSLEDHIEHVNKVITKLQAAGLPIDIHKSEFHVHETKYLGLIIGTEGIKMDPSKIRAISEWETPRKLEDVQAFVGFANFYRQFIFKYSKLAAPLTDLTRNGPDGKKPAFNWTEEAQQAFDALKSAFIEEPILVHFDAERETMVETDASDNVVACVASQKHNILAWDGSQRTVWKPVAYFSKKMSPAERNYDIYDKELLAIVKSFDELRPELSMATEQNPTHVVTDHKNLEYFMTTKRLNSRQARWSEKLSEFCFQITFRPGRLNERADALTRRTQDHPTENTLAHRDVVLIKPHMIAAPTPDPVRLAAMLTRRQKQQAEQTQFTTPVVVAPEESRSPIATPPEQIPIPEAAALAESRSTQAATTEQTPTPVAAAPAESRSSTEETLEDDDQREITTSLQQCLLDAASNDNEYQAVASALKRGMDASQITGIKQAKVNPWHCSVSSQGLVRVQGKIWAPKGAHLTVLKFCHSTPAAGHPGKARTMELVRRQFFWPKMAKDVKRFVYNCRCRTTKPMSRFRS